MDTKLREQLLALLVVAAVLAAGWFAYRPGLGGAFLLDDGANLGDLSSVNDSASAWRFVLSGTAGPTGRPLALASFLPQADSWDAGAAPFLTVNILIHLANAVLVACFLGLLSLCRGSPRSDSRWIAVTGMAVWLFMPLLATSSLMVVQRMTTLSATFALLGLNGYLLARRSAERGGRAGLSGMSAVLVAATLLAVLTKESGALLPLFVLVVETTLFVRPAGVPAGRWRAWSSVFLALPAVLLLGYLATRLPYGDVLVQRRDFTGWQRLLTESRVLWQYLFDAFAPRPGRYTPFHDGYPVARSLFEPLTFLAFAGWVVTAALALAWRRKHSLFAFAVLWFLTGHLIESTTVALELYFEHRNYLPVIGPVYALSSLAITMPARYRILTRAGISLYILVNAFFLFSLTTLWGNPPMAMRYWHEHHPESERAATELATQQLATEGPAAALKTMRATVAHSPEHAYLGIPALSLSCIIAPDEDHRREAASLAKLLPAVEFSYTAGTMLSDLVTTVARNPCRGVDLDTVANLARILAANPRYAADAGYQSVHHQLMARIARESGDTDKTLAQLHLAMEYQRSARLNMMVVTTLVSAGRFDDARAFIEEAGNELPLHPLKRRSWRRDLAELSTYVEKSAERPAHDTQTSGESGTSGNR